MLADLNVNKGTTQSIRIPTFGGLRYSEQRNSVIDRKGQRVSLRPKTLEVFRFLVDNQNSVVSRESLFETVWADVVVTEDSLSKCIAEIRKILGPDAREILKTIPKRGYVIIADPHPHPQAEQIESIALRADMLHGSNRIGILALALFLLLVISLSYLGFNTSEDNVTASHNQFAPTLLLDVSMSSESSQIDPIVLFDELSLSLSRYRTIQLVRNKDADYSLEAIIGDDTGDVASVYLRLIDNRNSTEVFLERVDLSSSSTAPNTMAARISALVASPATGAIGRNLLNTSRRKPVEELTRAECYAHSYDCTNCSGELDSIDKRAQTCLTSILTEDNEDVRAWALQSTIYAKQYQWSTNLGEPRRTHANLRQEIAQKAISAANRAEQLSDGTDSSVYWGMALAYMAACNIPKMNIAINRGLQINPEDPGLLATFGNWLAYTGKWDEGVEMVEQALALEPKHYKRWWLFAIAKRHYINSEYQEALDVFEQAFNERNWLSHLQLAYTLPFLDRVDDAKIAAQKLQYVFPGVTVEVALQLYKSFCFTEEYLAKMREGLQRAGLPERGDSSDSANIVMPMSRIAKLGNWDVEYMDLGQGIPVVFVHGAMSDYRSWAHYQNLVSDKYRYISYSRRYHGSQTWHDEGKLATVSQHAADLERFIEHLDAGPVVLVTWSSGSSTSTAFALKRPDLVTGIVLYEPNTLQLDDPEESTYPQAENKRFSAGFKRVLDHLNDGQIELATKAYMETVFEKNPGEFETELMWIRRIVLDNTRTVPLSFAANRNPDIEIECDDLASLKAPALVMVGKRTNAIWQYRAKKFVECAPNASLKSIAGVNHAGPIRVPTIIFSHIDRFIESF